MNKCQKLVAASLGLFTAVVVVEKFFPQVIDKPWWNPFSLSKYGIYAAPSTPTLAAIALMAIAVALPDKKCK